MGHRPSDDEQIPGGVRHRPSSALEHFLPLASGTYAGVSEKLLERTHARMTQGGCAPGVTKGFGEVAKRFAEIS